MLHQITSGELVTCDLACTQSYSKVSCAACLLGGAVERLCDLSLSVMSPTASLLPSDIEVSVCLDYRI